jgi:hypothetical protein
VLGDEIEGQLGVVVLLRPFATPLRYILAAFSMAALPQSSRKRPANSFVAMKHRGSWFCTDNRSHGSERFFIAALDHVNMVAYMVTYVLVGHERPILTMPVKSRQRCVLGLGWHVQIPHHLRIRA